MCEGDGGRREGWKNEAVNGEPCHWSYGKKHRMNWKNERKVQKGAEGKEKTSLTTCLSPSLSLSLLLLHFLLTGRLWRGWGSPLVEFSDRRVFVLRKKVRYQQDLKLTVICDSALISLHVGRGSKNCVL